MIEINKLEQYINLKGLEFIAKEVVAGFLIGMHRSPFHGFSVEFAEHRAYNKGESTKNIDWKLFARADKLFTKKYEEETNLRCYILIDNSSSMIFPYKEKNTLSKLAFSVYSAAALIYLMKKQRDATGLVLFSDDIELKLDAKISQTHNKLLFSKLENLYFSDTLKKQSRTAESIHKISELLTRRSLIIIFSDMLDNTANIDEIFAALQHLKYNKNEVVLFHTLNKQLEQEFDYKNVSHKFIDLETNEEVKINPNEVKENYQNSTKELFNSIKNKCLQNGIDIIEADTQKGFNDILLSYLIKRSKMI